MDENRADDLSPAAPLEEETFAFPFLKDDSLKSKQIGPYELLEVLGEGGMGVVYLAEQREPIERRVALKVIKLGMDSKQVIARFESERQALALMNHPHIAKVFDAGTTKEGRPYFVMEYVEGTSITTYCNTQRLGARERLELMLPVCQAVHHAHQKGIIHRDLKPSNILVSVEDGRPQPKVIDFGVAKATQHRLTEKTLVTQQGFRLGTPGYMSPEQAEITGMDIDTTTDVYSLGVVLYSLLTGVLPFDREQLLEGGYSEMQRIIREEEPLKPSTRVKALGEKATDIASARQTDTRSLTKNLRGDLDWITLKCLEKDRTRRYQSAAELAADLQRHLRDEPVLASPPSTVYRMKKFVLRHRVGVAAGALVVLALTLGIAGTTMGMLRALRAEAEASTQAGIASREAAAAQQVADFLVELFEVSDPEEARGNSITAREMLDKGAERIASELADEPIIQAQLMHTIGNVYEGLGLYEPAASLLEQAVAVRERELGADHLDLAASFDSLGDVYRRQVRYDEAEPLMRRALSIREAALGLDHPLVASSLNDLANSYEELGRYAEAEPLFKRALAIKEVALGLDHPSVGTTLNDLAIVYWDLGRYAEAEPLYRRALAIQETAFGPVHPDVGNSLNNLALVYWNMGRNAEAEPLFKRALAIAEAILGPDHHDVGRSLNNLALLYSSMGRYTEAEPLYRRALAIKEAGLGPDHPLVANSLNNLADVYTELERYAEAEPLYRRALAIREATLGPDHPDVANSLHGLANLDRDQNRLAAAEALYERALAILEQVDAEHPGVASSLNDLAKLYAMQGRTNEAEQAFQRALAIRERSLGADHLEVAETLEDYAELLRQLERAQEAEKIEQRVRKIRAADTFH